MSYVVHFWAMSIPRTIEEAVRFHGELSAQAGIQNPAFIELAAALTARHPCITTLDEEDESGVWSDGPLNGLTRSKVYSVGILSDHIDAVQPFVVETATSLRLVVFDEQQGCAYLPGGNVVDARGRHMGTHLGMDLRGRFGMPLIERTVADLLQPLLLAAGFEPVPGANLEWWRGHAQLPHCLRFVALGDGQDDKLWFDLELVFNSKSLHEFLTSIMARHAGKKLAGNRLVATRVALSRVALFYRLSGSGASLNPVFHFGVKDVAELTAFAKALRSCVTDYLLPLLEQCQSLGSLAVYSHSGEHHAFRILGSRVTQQEDGLSVATIGGNLFDWREAEYGAIGVLLGAIAEYPNMQKLVDAVRAWIPRLPPQRAVIEQEVLDATVCQLQEEELPVK